MSSVITATDETFNHLVQSNNGTVLVDFWAPWCQPCLRVSPMLDALAEERAATLTVIKVNVDEEPSLANRFGIQSIPTIVRMDHGQETRRVIGAYPKAQFLSQIGL